MSMPFSTIQCDICLKEWVTHVFWGAYSYRLPDRRIVKVDRTLAWCDSCNNFVTMEQIPKPEETEERLAEASRQLEANKTPKKHLFLDLIKLQIPSNPKDIKLYKKTLAKAEALKDWRVIRKSPPKCLSCGSTNVREAHLWGSSEKEPIRHLNCGGAFLVEESKVRISKRLKHRFYDVEGNFLWEEDDR